MGNLFNPRFSPKAGESHRDQPARIGSNLHKGAALEHCIFMKRTDNHTVVKRIDGKKYEYRLLHILDVDNINSHSVFVHSTTLRSDHLVFSVIIHTN